MTTVIAYVYVLIRVCTRRGLCGLSARSAILYVWAWAFCCLSFSKAMRRPACGISEIQTPHLSVCFFSESGVAIRGGDIQNYGLFIF